LEQFSFCTLQKPFLVQNVLGGGGAECQLPVALQVLQQQLTCAATSAHIAHCDSQGLQPWLFLQHQTAVRNGAGVLGESVAGMNGRNYDLLLCRMTTIANRHEELKQQLEMMTKEEVQNILNERRSLKISTRLENYEEALKLNPLETPKVVTRRRPPQMIQKAREVKWSSVAFRGVCEGGAADEELGHGSPPPHVTHLHDEEIQAEHFRPGVPKRLGAAAAGGGRKHPTKTSTSPQPKTLLPPLPSLPEELQHQSSRSCREAPDLDRLHRTTAIESIRLQLQKEQLKHIQAKFDAIKAFPGYVPPPAVYYSNPDEQLQAPWRSKVLHTRPARDKKPWALPEALKPRRKKKAVAEAVAEEITTEEVVAVAPVKSAMEMMMLDMDDAEEEGEEGGDSEQADDQAAPGSVEQQQPQVHEQDPHSGGKDESQSSTDQALPTAGHAGEEKPGGADARGLHSPPAVGRPDTSASAASEADSVFTRDSDIGAAKKAIVLTGEATHAIIMEELSGNIDFEDILLEKVLSGEEIYKISTSRGSKKPLRTGDLFLLGRFMKGDVMLVPESYQESDGSSGDDEDYVAVKSGVSVASGSRANSRGGARAKSRSRSRPSTREGDSGFIMASDFVQVSTTQLIMCSHRIF
jgi:hypothetical protein